MQGRAHHLSEKTQAGRNQMYEAIQVYLIKADCHILTNTKSSIYFIPSPLSFSFTTGTNTDKIRNHSLVLDNLDWSWNLGNAPLSTSSGLILSMVKSQQIRLVGYCLISLLYFLLVIYSLEFISPAENSITHIVNNMCNMYWFKNIQ